MSEHDRGAYTPQTDAPLTFDARDARGGGGPTPMTLLVSAIVLMAMIVALLLFYRHGARHSGQAPELVGAPVGQTKSPPPADAQSSDQAAGLQVYKDEAAPRGESVAPPSFEQTPEQPAPLPAPRPVAPPPAVLTPEPTPHVSIQPRPGHVAPPPVAKVPAPARPIEVTKAPAPMPVAPRAEAGAAGAGSTASGSQSSHVAAGHPASATFKSGAPPTPVKPASAAKPTAAATTPTASPAAAGGGGATVQIGAFSSSALAQKGWSDTAKILPDQMAGKSRAVEETSKDGKTFYRAFVGGFATRADAAGFCAALKAKSKPCFVK